MKIVIDITQISLEDTEFIENFLNEMKIPFERTKADYSKPVRKCKNCGSDFNYKHWNKQYCNDDCKYEYHEKTKGFDIEKFRKGKAKKGKGGAK